MLKLLEDLYVDPPYLALLIGFAAWPVAICRSGIMDCPADVRPVLGVALVGVAVSGFFWLWTEVFRNES